MLNHIVRNLKKFDWVLLAAVFLLFCLGLSAIYSVSLSETDNDFSDFKKQSVFGLFGFAVLLILGLKNYSWLRVYSKTIYTIALLLLILVLFIGTDIRGTRGWFSVFGLGIQPVELAKVALLISLAKFFSNRFYQFKVWKHILIGFFLTTIFAVAVMLQPDLGSAMVLMGLWLGLLVLSGTPKKFLIFLLIIFVVTALLGWQFFLQDYQKDRIVSFINPEADPRGSGYNVSQSVIAIGSGGVWGKGLGFGSQSQLRFIPESRTDFIFAVIAEELGFFGVSLMLFLYGVIFYRLFLIARSAYNDFGLYLVVGVIILLFLHLIINVGMNMGIMPVTGLALPFLSYGGSFLMICLVLIGIAQSVRVRGRFN